MIDEESAPVRVLWAHMDLTDLQDAKEALCDREGIPVKDLETRIGVWQIDDERAPGDIPDLPVWAKTFGLDAVIWTALGPKFEGKDVRPTEEQVISYLRGLLGSKRDEAERYVRCAPRQIDTRYRRRIEGELGWVCISL